MGCPVKVGKLHLLLCVKGELRIDKLFDIPTQS